VACYTEEVMGGKKKLRRRRISERITGGWRNLMTIIV
jgi:hypothetical protein